MNYLLDYVIKKAFIEGYAIGRAKRVVLDVLEYTLNKAVGFDVGRIKQKYETIKELIAQDIMTVEKASEYFNIPVETLKELCAGQTNLFELNAFSANNTEL